ncbi:DUF4349 domain-containing protein [Micromonospora sp. NBC_01699]|uniref:DUF4349 domain-containing protein n=1 Tax=Micromonospora sp. NBC_01699 TaxID=2975984 RepID=UPI002E2915E2|nr:DUF4349 domain-containing protein [Micromonospora sp. NBC_01699]
MRATARRRWGGFLGTAALVAVLVLTGCSSRDEATNASSAADTAAVGGAADRGSGGKDGAAPKAAEPGAEVPSDLRVDQRSIVYTGSMTVRVKEVERAAAEAVTIATGAGGFVGGDQRTSDTGDAQASLTLRVPADRFNSVVDALAKLGRQERREIKTEDVTEETLDLQARISTQQARVESGRRLLAQAKSLTDLVLLEGELAKREADLVALQARQRRLADLTALSTITVRLVGPETVVMEEEEEEPSGFLDGLRGGWEALLGTLRVVLIVVGALLPWLTVVGVPALVVIWLVRRNRRRRTPVGPFADQPAPVVPAPRNEPPADIPADSTN